MHSINLQYILSKLSISQSQISSYNPRFIPVFFLLLLCSELIAQLPDILRYTVNSCHYENRLPRSSGKDVVPGKDGWIWLIAENGLIRFDEVYFKLFNVYDIGVSSDRFLWIKNPYQNSDGLSALNSTMEAPGIWNAVASVDSLAMREFFRILADGLPKTAENPGVPAYYRHYSETCRPHTDEFKEGRQYPAITLKNTRQFVLVVPENVYKTWGLILLALTIVIVLVWCFPRLLNQRLLKRNELLERMVETRTQSLNLQVQAQYQMLASLSHDVRSPLKAVMWLSNSIRQSNSAENYILNTEALKSISETISTVLVLIDNLLEFIKIRLTQDNVQYVKINLYYLAQERIQLFDLPFKRQRNKIFNKIPKNTSMTSNPQFIGTIINNLLDNANKNTLDGEIAIAVDIRPGVVVLSVSDTGTGIPGKILEWLNEEDSLQKKTVTSQSKPTAGLGLVIIKEIAQNISAKIVAVSTSSGSVISLYMPQGGPGD